MGTIYVLWIRQIKRYYRSRARVIGSLGQPLLFLLALGFGFGPIYARAGGGNYIEFLAPGIIAMSIIFMAIFMGIEIIWDRQFGFLKEMLVAPVSRLQIMIGRTVGGATVAMAQGIIVFVLAYAVGFRPTTYAHFFFSLIFMFLIAILFTALGTAIASLLDDMHAFQLIINFLVMPIFFLSGALFPLDGLPKALQIIVRLDPLSYGVDGLRGALIAGSAHFSLLYDASLLGIITFVLLVVGSYLFSKIQI